MFSFSQKSLNALFPPNPSNENNKLLFEALLIFWSILFCKIHMILHFHVQKSINKNKHYSNFEISAENVMPQYREALLTESAEGS